MSTLAYLIIALSILIVIGIVRIFNNPKDRSKLKSFKVKTGIYYIINVKSVAHAIDLGHHYDIPLLEDDLEEMDVIISPRWDKQIISKYIFNELIKSKQITIN